MPPEVQQKEEPVFGEVVPNIPDVTQPVAAIAQPKKKRIYWLIGGAVLVTVVAVAAYYVLSQLNPKADTTTTTGTQQQSSAATATQPTALQDATSAYTNNPTDESKLIQSTDDSQLGNDAAKSAGNIGDSIDENGL
jgi:flagellar basal body-associated protein FliL